MRSYNCTPESHPILPPTYQHPLWYAWDLAVDHIMSQIPQLLNKTAEYNVRDDYIVANSVSNIFVAKYVFSGTTKCVSSLVN